MIINGRRPLNSDEPDTNISYHESDRDYVLNNIDACVQFLDGMVNQSHILIQGPYDFQGFNQ